MKKTYMRPSVKVTLLETIKPLAQSNVTVKFGGQELYGTADAKGRRGTWGDLWAEDEE